MSDQSITTARLFNYFRGQPEESRASVLAEIGKDDPELERELRALFDRRAQPHTATTISPPLDQAVPGACGACGAVIDPGSRYCSACGTPMSDHSDAHEGPFRTGSLFAGRFRIVTKLGEGGMGVVYRAHDLTLDQAVAVKVINESRLVSAAAARARLRSEVRLARQIGHPNVCRVYDIGESGDVMYVSMEYVDGEDLGSLLSRIGRLPVDKGMEVARKLCAGLAAAHARDVLHRDLKPRNIMIDAHGEVRIMDFGLAVIPSQLDARDIGSGTPLYMAPEQLAGREVTRQSDLYALGLVLYELFTGKRPFDATPIDDLRRQRETSDVTWPSRHVAGLSSELDRVIIQCLDPNPQKRPTSALHIAAALPIGDPLADAIAAGETPAPSVVAAAGENEGVRPALAIGLLTAAIASVLIVCAATPYVQIAGRVPLRQPPAALTAKARDIANTLGHSATSRHVSHGFSYDADQIGYLRRTMRERGRARMPEWAAALSRAPYPLAFWYHESSSRLSTGPQEPLSWTHMVPADLSTQSGSMLSMKLDVDGRLLRFAAAGPRGAADADARRQRVNWDVLFTAAGLDIAAFSSVSPLTTPHVAFDQQQAWTGPYFNAAEAVRVEAASYAGSVVLFEILFPWTTSPSGMVPPAQLGSDLLILALLVLVAGVAAHNWKLQRGDPRGAWRLGVFTASGYALSLSLAVEPSALASGVWTALAFSLSLGLVVATVYLALEPWVRRLWPHALITWARVLTGRWRDAVVGRDVLIGAAVACMNAAIQRLAQLAAVQFGATPAHPVINGDTFGFYLGNLASDRLMIADRMMSFVRSLDVLIFFFVVFIARVVLKRQWRATIAYLLFWHVILSTRHFMAGDWLAVIYWTIELSVLLALTVRFGLLATVAFGTCSILINRGVLSLDFGEWYGRSSAVTMAIVTGIAIVAFRVSLGRRNLWDSAALERNALARATGTK
jgi:predicted Ser/Thr protein kinase